MRESKEPIASLDMSSFIRYRRLQMPRMGNASAKKPTRDASRDIFDRLFPSGGGVTGGHVSPQAKKSREKDDDSLNSVDSGQGVSMQDSLLSDGLRSSCSEGNTTASSSENESDFSTGQTRDDSEIVRLNRTRDCFTNLPCRGPRPHSTPPPRLGDCGGGPDRPGPPSNDHSKGVKKVVGGTRSRKIGVGSKLTSGHKYRYKDKTSTNKSSTSSSDSASFTTHRDKLCDSSLERLDEHSHSEGSDSALDPGSSSDGDTASEDRLSETVSRISISSDDGELANIEKFKCNTEAPARNIESPVNGYRKVLFVCNL